MKLEELVKTIIKNGICVSSVDYDSENDSLVYGVTGFAKSGLGELYTEKNGDIMCRTRYGKVDKINTFKDLVFVAYEWNRDYQHEYGWNEQWIPHFESAGLIKTKEVKTIDIIPIA